MLGRVGIVRWGGPAVLMETDSAEEAQRVAIRQLVLAADKLMYRLKQVARSSF